MITWDTLLILLAIGAIHSALLWTVIDWTKSAGLKGRFAIRAFSIAIGAVSAFVAFPFALRIVAGIELVGLEERSIGAMLGIPAAIGAEGMYRMIDRSLGEIVAAAIERFKR